MVKNSEKTCPICDGEIDYTEWYDERGIVEHLSECESCDWKSHFAYGDHVVEIKNSRWELPKENPMMKKLMEREIEIVCEMYKTVFFKNEKPNKKIYDQFLIITKVRDATEEKKFGRSTFDATGF